MNNLPKVVASCSHPTASVTKQYNLVPAKSPEDDSATALAEFALSESPGCSSSGFTYLLTYATAETM